VCCPLAWLRNEVATIFGILQYNPDEHQYNPDEHQYNPNEHQYNPDEHQYNPDELLLSVPHTFLPDILLQRFFLPDFIRS
jgi:hypothetical protein